MGLGFSMSGAEEVQISLDCDQYSCQHQEADLLDLQIF
jgi:hypothetical protein